MAKHKQKPKKNRTNQPKTPRISRKTPLEQTTLHGVILFWVSVFSFTEFAMDPKVVPVLKLIR